MTALGHEAELTGVKPRHKVWFVVVVCLFFSFGQCYVSSSFARRFLRCCENHFLGGHFYYEQLSGKQVTWWSSCWDLMIENCLPCSRTVAI